VVLNRSGAYYGAMRIFTAFLGAGLLFELYYGGGNGAAFLWLFVLPTSLIFLLGFKEGIFWVGGLLIVMGILLFGKIGYAYPFDLAIRFFVVFTVITFLSCSLEILRERSLKELITEKEALQKAFDEITVLKGMVPICSSCKKIRDDKGFWTQIEAYMKNHSTIEFSHGICPECASKYYPSSSTAKQFREKRDSSDKKAL